MTSAPFSADKFIFDPDDESFFGKLHKSEMFWRKHCEYLGRCGYTLRPRYQPDWRPSWLENPETVYYCEASVGVGSSIGVIMDATRADGTIVVLKRVPLTPTVFEIEIGLLFSSEPLASDPRNHCVPILDVLDIPGQPKERFVVMPYLMTTEQVLFNTIGEIVEHFRQLFELKQRDFSDYSTVITSRTLKPVRYHIIDFGLSRQFLPGVTPRLELPPWGGDNLRIITVNAATVSSTPAQTFHGIGGSGAWWPNDLINFPEATRQNLSSLLFSSSGLGLSSYRYNVGAGGVNVSNPTRAPQTFYVSPGVYNFSRDPGGVYFLTQAASFGVPHLTAFANSAPAPLTSGGASCNGEFVTGTGEEYGTFLAGVVQHFRSIGIEIDSVSPMNEPDDNFGPSPCGQEEVVTGLYDALSAINLTSAVGIIVDESSSLSNAENEYSAWLPQVVDKVTALCHHTYDFPSDSSYESYVTSTRELAPDTPTWMTEALTALERATRKAMILRGFSYVLIEFICLKKRFVEESPTL
ncbi:hypothetical protein H0H92_002018 [Tricholoma furcatifolium]|nr:hypothetical protein H0H92_002018 [Tricholoma furcatifolium]